MIPKQQPEGWTVVRLAVAAGRNGVAARTRAGALREWTWIARTPAWLARPSRRPQRRAANAFTGGNRRARA